MDISVDPDCSNVCFHFFYYVAYFRLIINEILKSSFQVRRRGLHPVERVGPDGVASPTLRVSSASPSRRSSLRIAALRRTGFVVGNYLDLTLTFIEYFFE